MVDTNALSKARQEIDRIDDQLHDLIIERAIISKEIQNLKKESSIKIRPGREAQIIYRLLDRHKSNFPVQELIRVWREIITGSLRMQGPFSIAAFEPDGELDYCNLARDHYGSFSPIHRYSSCRAVVEAIRQDKATVGVLPWPERGADDIWLRFIAFDSDETPKIIARLPFAGPSNIKKNYLESAVIAKLSQEETGHDNSLIAIESTIGISEAEIQKAIEHVKFEFNSCFLWTNHDQPKISMYLVEIANFVDPKGTTASSLKKYFEGKVSNVIHLGGYALPPQNFQPDKFLSNSKQDG